MELIAKRKVGESWRAAVGARADRFGMRRACLGQFDELVGSGLAEGDAAYLCLAEAGLLWRISGGGLAPSFVGDPADLGSAAEPGARPAARDGTSRS